MADFPAMPVWVQRYLGDTRHLRGPAEHGAYLLLLMESWLRPSCSLPDDDDLLARLACCSKEEWAELKPIVMGFWDLDSRRKEWTQKGQRKERLRVAEKSAKQSHRAKSGWNKRKNINAAAMPDQLRGNATHNHNHTDEERTTNVVQKKISPASILSPLLGEKLAGEVVEHRQRIRAPMTAKAAQLMLKEFEQCSDPPSGAEMMIVRGWRGFKNDWFENETAKAKGNGNGKLDRMLNMATRVDGRTQAEGDMDRGEGAGASESLFSARLARPD